MAARVCYQRLGLQRPATLVSSAPKSRLSTFGSRRAFTSSARSETTGRAAFAAVPLAAGLALYLVPRETSPIPTILSSPAVIPCRSSEPALLILSPAEPHRTLLARIKALLKDWIVEPVLTARRFVYLFAVFMPVIISSPMLLVGNPEKRLNGDRWGAAWWYNFLVRQMARAGPTFIKVCTSLSFTPV
jgi:aarF domain-containing kinase